MKSLLQRYEKKYLINRHMFEEIYDFLSQYLDKDIHHKGNKPYKVETTYFDNEQNHLIRTSLSKPSYKQKLRLRSYDDETHFLELKKKFQGHSYKLRKPLTRQDKNCLLDQTFDGFDNSIQDQEFKHIIQKYHLKPKLNVSYERFAFEDASIGLRVTLDKNISFHYLSDDQTPLVEDYILEIKCHLAFPLWLVSFLSEHNIYPQSLSKYGMSYTRHKQGA